MEGSISNGAGTGNTGTNVNSNSIYEMYTEATSLLETEQPQRAIIALQQIQQQVARQSYFSSSSSHKNNQSSETMDDIATFVLPYLTVEYHLAMAYTQLRVRVDYNNNSNSYDTSNTNDGNSSSSSSAVAVTRRTNLLRACDYFNAFLQRLEAYDALTKEDTTKFRMLMELTDHVTDNVNTNDGDRDGDDDNTGTSSRLQLAPPTMNRDEKIAQHRLKQQLQQEQDRLQSLQLRRRRLQATISDDDEVLDGYDNESLIRTTFLSLIQIAKLNTVDEWSSILQELPMIAMMIQQSGSDDRYNNHNSNHNHNHSNHNSRHHDPRQPTQKPMPMELTQITKDSMTGQLRIHRQEIQGRTFRPSWNQPTMSLEELADHEVRGAMQRQEQQEQSELYNQTQPRRYEQLVKDGMEDQMELVDASAVLDREWDTFKDNNPRGSGNKRGDVGDRNF